MKGCTFHNSSAPSSSCTLVNKNKNRHYKPNGILDTKKTTSTGLVMGNAAFMKWRSQYLLGVLRYHPIPCVLALSLFFFMGVEYTIPMIPPSSPPFDLGFVLTLPIHHLLVSAPTLNALLAALNTVFVLMQTGYILWTWIIEGRPRATISTLFMFTFRGILGYSTQLPLPENHL